MVSGPFRLAAALATVVKVTAVTGLFRRVPTQTVARRAALLISSLVLLGTMAGPSAAAAPGSGGPSSTSGSAIDATQAQVDAVEAQFAAQQQSLAQLSEQYDQANVHLGQINGELSVTDARLVVARKKHAAAHHALAVVAVNAYMYDTPSSQLTTMFSTPSESSALRDEYQSTAVAN